MAQELVMITLVVRDYDEAIEYFLRALRFTLVEDTRLTAEKRWVVVKPGGESGLRLLLAKAASPAQLACVGNQAGGRVFLFLHTDAFWSDYEFMRAQGVHFIEQPRQEKYGTVVVFQDLYGNKWDLVDTAGESMPGR